MNRNLDVYNLIVTGVTNCNLAVLYGKFVGSTKHNFHQIFLQIKCTDIISPIMLSFQIITQWGTYSIPTLSQYENLRCFEFLSEK